MSRLYRAMAKNPTHFTFKVIEECKGGRHEANKIEAELIQHYKADHPAYGYNGKIGGGSHSVKYDETVYIYLIHNTHNNMYYIGLSNKPNVRWEQHKKAARELGAQSPTSTSTLRVSRTGAEMWVDMKRANLSMSSFTRSGSGLAYYMLQAGEKDLETLTPDNAAEYAQQADISMERVAKLLQYKEETRLLAIREEAAARARKEVENAEEKAKEAKRIKDAESNERLREANIARLAEKAKQDAALALIRRTREEEVRANQSTFRGLMLISALFIIFVCVCSYNEPGTKVIAQPKTPTAQTQHVAYSTPTYYNLRLGENCTTSIQCVGALECIQGTCEVR